MDRAFKAIEDMRLAVHDHFEGLVVLVATNFAARHDRPPSKVYRMSDQLNRFIFHVRTRQTPRQFRLRNIALHRFKLRSRGARSVVIIRTVWMKSTHVAFAMRREIGITPRSPGRAADCLAE